MGRVAYEDETFGGNGRTCLSCHDEQTGTLSLEEINRRFIEEPDDPIFLWDGTDDFVSGNTRLLEHGTFLVRKELPPGTTLLSDPSATDVILARGVPTTLNIALDPVLMLDGREPDLPTQALNAIIGHAQNTVEPSQEELEGIAAFQRLAPQFFSSPQLHLFDLQDQDPMFAPELPAGTTASEIRGRRFFESVPLDFEDGTGFCAACHGGPMLNTANEFNCPTPAPCDPNDPFTTPAGTRFTSSLISELNRPGNPVHQFEVQTPGGPIVVESPDPGRALVSGDWAPFPFGDLHAFKTPTLWGVEDTAPYMHDNSIEDLEGIALHYREFFLILNEIGGFPFFVFTDQDLEDMVAYMKLL